MPQATDLSSQTTTLSLQANQRYSATVLVSSGEIRTVQLYGDNSDPLLANGPFVGCSSSANGNLMQTNLGTKVFTTESSGKVTVNVTATDPGEVITSLQMSDALLTQLVVVSRPSVNNVLFDDVLVVIHGPLI
jgi:hypothetical protein